MPFRDSGLKDVNELLGDAQQHHQLPWLYMQVLEGFVKKGDSTAASWDAGDSLSVTPTGWSERTYDVKLLYGSLEV